MTSQRTTLFLAALAFLPVTGLAAVAHAHPVTVDGSAAEWLGRTANLDNLGLVARNAAGAGEHAWRDATGDTRTDLASPESIADVQTFAVTGDATGLSFLVVLAAAPGASAPVQVQIAIDEDRVSGSGQTFLAGFADTSVPASAAWEHLVQTQLTTGNFAVVRDASFATVGAALPVGVGTTAGGAQVLELTVPWARLGLGGPPSTALRFTVATFRENPSGDTVDIGGPTVSNALDAVTDYGTPGVAAPNTFVEVSDQLVDYSFDVWFNAAGEVYAPLVVARFVSDATAAAGNEWIMLRNMTPVTLDLAGYRVGDEETARAGEGMYAFPTGATLASGATFVAAASGTDYFGFYGVRADGEWSTADTMTPDMPRYTTWSSGSIALSNTGDEILVLDRSHTALDIVVYGTGAYAGVTSLTPVPGSNRVATRDAVLSDTDDCHVDFTAAGATCASSATCGVCGACVMNGCGFLAAGTVCRGSMGVCDADETCTGAASACPPDGFVAAGTVCRASTDVCDVEETCTGGAAACPADAVAASTTVCRTSAGTCDVAETCDGAGTACPPDAFEPSATVCRTAVGACDVAEACTGAGASCPTNGFAASGTGCADGDVCNGAETCDGTGICTSGTPLSCPGATACTAAACDPTAGCTTVPLAAGTLCDDGDLCNGVDMCDGSGACVAGTGMLCVDAGPPDAGPVDLGTIDDAGADAGADDASTDAAVDDAATDDASTDAAVDDAATDDAATDGAVDDASTDAAVDAGDDGAVDAGDDAAVDAGGDAATPRDAATDGLTGGDAGMRPVSRGGCCSVSGVPDATGSLLVALAVVGLVATRRRRRN